MIVNGHTLPKLFVSSIENKTFVRKVGSWGLIENRDSFGNKLETELGQIWQSEKEILKETMNLENGFMPDGIYGEESEYAEEPGYIEDIIDFKDIVNFAISGDGAPFCFDYRLSKVNPEMIWWDDVYWRKISNSYDKFISLFKINS